MKSIFRLFASAAVVTAVIMFGAALVSAQDNCADEAAIASLDERIRANWERDETVKTALTAAREYLQKYGKCEQTKAFADWLIDRVPKWEARAAAFDEYVWRSERVARFDEGIRNKKFDDVYFAGAELTQRYPDNVHYLLPLGLIGLYESYRNNLKYNDDAIRYAKLALAKLKSGTAEPKKERDGKTKLDGTGKPVFGAFQFERNAEEAISELTYALGYILYNAKKDKRAGLLYYYEAAQTPGPYKTEPRLYATIGQHYLDESAPRGKEIVELIKKLDAAKTDDEKLQIEAELKPKIALHNGYLERALDAFSRAYRFADEKIASEKVVKEQVYKMLKDTYGRREPPVPIDKWIADAGTYPLPDPSSDVSPVFDPEPVRKQPEEPASAPPASTKKTAAKRPAAAKKKLIPAKKPRR